MAEYIDREAIKYELWGVGPLNEPLMVVRKTTIDKLPAADVAPVRRGRWIYDGENHFCNRCNRDALCDRMTGEEVLSNSCPHCGAIMDGGKDDG